MADVDMPPVAADPTESAPPVAVGDPPGSQPAPVDTTVQDEPTPPQETAEEAEKRKQSRAQARAFASLRRNNEQLQRQLGRLEERLSTVAAPSQEKSGPPKQTDFNNFDDWLAARDEWLLGQATERFSKAAGTKSQPEADPAEKGTRFWKDAARQAKELGIKDFDDAMDAIQSGEVPTSPAMSHYVVEDAENKAALVAWLAENPDEAERISRLDAVRAGAALAKVDARLGRKPRQVSAAPAPAPDLRGGGTASPSLERMSHEDLTKLVGKWNRAV